MNGVPLGPVDLIAELNAIGGKHGVGVVDLVEDRLVGMKSRGVYETPGGSLLYTAHSSSSSSSLDRRTLAAKDLIAPRYADLVYEGRWWTTEREAYDAFVDVTQERVTGSVTLRLYKGSTAVVGRESEHALYDERFVTFGEDDVYQQSDAAGFIRLFALPARVRALKDQEMALTAATSPVEDAGRAGAADRVTATSPVTSGAVAQALGWALRRRTSPRSSMRSTSSIAVDFRLWPHDVRLSKAWAVALYHAGVLSLDESNEIERGLDRVAVRLQGGEPPAPTRRGCAHADRSFAPRGDRRRRVEAAYGP